MSLLFLRPHYLHVVGMLESLVVLVENLFCLENYCAKAANYLFCAGWSAEWRVTHIWRAQSHGCSKGELFTCCVQVGAPSGGSLIPGEPGVIGTTAHEQLIICCAQVGAPSVGSLISGETGVMGAQKGS
jgi:hypothetical protein